MRIGMATKYTRQARTGQKGVEFVRRVAAESGCIYRPFESADVGIDGALEFVNDTGEPTGDLILVQIKSGPSYVKAGRFFLRADRNHFETWLRYAMPVVGIVYDPGSDEARWVDIGAHLRRQPEQVANGPYLIETPATQPFSTASFEAFSARFIRPCVASTRVDATPNFLIRPWTPDDAKPTRALLAPIAADYPKFDEWLEHQWAKASVSKKVAEVDGAVAAYSMWTRKDDRNVKLQTFMVGQLFRGTAIGQHLLYHELRTWADEPRIERVFVTVSSSKAELIGYFRQFGFLVEGSSANRYPRKANAAELVLAKHFIRETVREPRELERVIGLIARGVWGVDPTGAPDSRFGVSAESWSIPLYFPEVQVVTDLREATVSPRVKLVSPSGETLRSDDDASLMREFFPLRVHLRNKRYAIVPIYAAWVKAMLSTRDDASASRPTSLKLRVDNVYYCYPKLRDLTAGDLVLFYEPKRDGGSQSAIGSAIVRETMLDTPEVLFGRFSDQGVYGIDDIRAHVSSGTAMAIHFELFEPFKRPITLAQIRKILQNHTNIQGLTKIARDQFERIRGLGLS